MADATRLGAKAADAIRRNGIDLTLVTRAGGTYSTATGSATPTEASVPCSGVVTELPTGDSRGDSTLDGDTSTRVARRRVLLTGRTGPLAAEPRAGDRLGAIEGRQWAIVGATPVSYRGTTLLYDLVVQS